MEEFDAGRSSVREALFALERQGLLVSKTGAVPRVSRPTAAKLMNELSGAVRHYLNRPEGLKEMQDARMLFEGALARRAATIATPEQVGAIEAALSANESATTLDEFAETDLEFHLQITHVSGNSIFEGLNGALSGWLRRQRQISAESGVSFAEVNSEHRDIFDAIAHHDPEKAGDAMENHLQSVTDRYWRVISGK